MAQPVKPVEEYAKEAVDLAEIANQLIHSDPRNRSAFAELATILGAGAIGAAGLVTGDTAPVAVASLPVAVAAVARLLSERSATREAMTLPTTERRLWEDAGAVFDEKAIELDAINATVAFSDLLMRSVAGDGAVAEILHVDRSRVSQRVREGSVYWFSRNETRYFPEWQFEGDSTLPGLRAVVSALDESLHPLVVDHWFTTTSVDLEVGESPVSPVVWLRTGGNPRVAAELAADL